MAVNPVQQSILDRVRTFPGNLAPITDLAVRYARYCSSVAIDETLQIAHMPWDGPEGYALRLYAPAKKAWFAKFQERTGHRIPAAYQRMLLTLNGGNFHDLDLFGLPPSLQSKTPVHDRSKSQPFDLEAANLHWIASFANRPVGFYFGSRAWSDDENLGYFWTDEELRAVRANGEVVGAWPDLTELLAHELPLAEASALEGVPAEWWH